MASVSGARQFTQEVTDEMKKVTWPDWPQLKNATLVVIAFVLLVVAIIWVMDVGVRVLLDVIMGLFTG